jgi:HK97 family phage prohead protease
MREQITRATPLLDIEIQRGGDGRTVTAYATPFGQPNEVRDHHGHYFEIIRSTSFDKSLSVRALNQIGVFYNHGKTLYGTPSERYSMPIGCPVEVKPDSKGLLTVTRYAKTELGDEVLELIASGAVTAMSFTASIYRSEPARRESGLSLPVIERVELDLKEYGPTPIPIAPDAKILAVRAADLLLDPDSIGDLTDEQRDELTQLLASTQPPPAQPPAGTPAPAAQDAPNGTPDTSTQPDGTSKTPAQPDDNHLLTLAAQRRRRTQ